MNNNALFRELDDKFLEDLKDESNPLNFVLDYERKNKGIIILEIRKNFLDIYFLGHGIEVLRQKKYNKYYLLGSKTFNPKPALSSEKLKYLVKDDDPKRWRIYLEDINNKDEFKEIMDTVISKIVIHRKGSISEGASEVNHFFDNREVERNGIQVIDRQVAYPGDGHKIDLLGIRRLADTDYTFSVVELKNKNNQEISTVFSQLRKYIDIVYNNYDSFVKTYKKVISQKIELKLMKKINFRFVPKKDISEKHIKGVVILDNFNIKKDCTQKGLLHRALEDWSNQPDKYFFELFLKTNVLDNTFFLDYPGVEDLLARYKANNTV